MQYMDYEKKSVKINTFKKEIKCFAVFFHCQILNGALYLDWVYFHMQSIFKNDPGDVEKPA